MTGESGPLDELIDGVDPALASAVLEIEQHIATSGWDQPARLYALACLILTRATTTSPPACTPSFRPPSSSRRSPRSPTPWGSTRPRPPGR